MAYLTCKQNIFKNILFSTEQKIIFYLVQDLLIANAMPEYIIPRKSLV
jgi:hypothetical protein